jgi:hypothetical protein
MNDKYFELYAKENDLPLIRVMNAKDSIENTLSFQVFLIREHLKEIFIYPFVKR